MLILGIETSCDETAIAVVECDGDLKSPRFLVRSSVVSSQIALHAPFGGVVPNIAKREHEVNLVPVLIQAMRESALLEKHKAQSTLLRQGYGRAQQNSRQYTEQKTQIQKILAREQELFRQLTDFLETYEVPAIDAIAVTQGPGLEPALWVGLNFGKALSLAWDKPLIPVNHMEGHIVAALLQQGIRKPESGIRTTMESGNRKQESERRCPRFQIPDSRFLTVTFPAVALLVSGGHTELVLMHDWKKYELLGQTRDDAVGEAFDKVARILGLPYPGGPEISKLAEHGQPNELVALPRPMIRDTSLDFSYAGLKTAVLYLVRDLGDKMDKQMKADIALEFESAAVEVLVSKTLTAIENTNAQTFILGGGVAANRRLRTELTEAISNNYPEIKLLLPDPKTTGDNAAMIAAAAYFHKDEPNVDHATLTADGNLRVAQITK
jgi:N6-L-threonylcarbamoyladenine synthase